MTHQRPTLLAIDDTTAKLLTLGSLLGGEFELQFTTSGAIDLEWRVTFSYVTCISSK